MQKNVKMFSVATSDDTKITKEIHCELNESHTIVSYNVSLHVIEAECPTYVFLLSFVFVSITATFGFIGNSLSIVTLNRDRTNWKSVTHFLLTVLAASDIALLFPVVVVILVPTYCSYYRGLCSDDVKQAAPYIEKYAWALASACHMITIYITMLVAFHRYVYVCRPHDTNWLSGLRRAKIHVAIVPIFAFFFNLPRLLEYEVKHYNVHVNQGDRTLLDVPDWLVGTVCLPLSSVRIHNRIELTALAQKDWFKIVYKNVCFYLFMFIIPLGVLVFVSIRLVQTLRGRKRNPLRGPKKSRQHEMRDNKVTLILVIIIVVFIVCQTPTVVQRLVLALANAEGLACGQPYNNLERSADYLVVFNSCVNFVVYVLFARRFRQILVTDILHCANHRAASYCNEFAECLAPSSEMSTSSVEPMQHHQIYGPQRRVSVLPHQPRDQVMVSQLKVINNGEGQTPITQIPTIQENKNLKNNGQPALPQGHSIISDTSVNSISSATDYNSCRHRLESLV